MTIDCDMDVNCVCLDCIEGRPHRTGDPDDGPWYADDDADCSFCGGDGYEECDDRIQCTERHINGMCRCVACNGSGRAKDQTIW